MKLKVIMIMTILGVCLSGCAQAQKKEGIVLNETGMAMQADSIVYKDESGSVCYQDTGVEDAFLN